MVLYVFDFWCEVWRSGDGQPLARLDLLFPEEAYRVTYVCDANGWRGVPAAAKDAHLVPSLEDGEAVARLVADLVAKDGPFDRVIAFSEYLLDLAASLRERFGV